MSRCELSSRRGYIKHAYEVAGLHNAFYDGLSGGSCRADDEDERFRDVAGHGNERLHEVEILIPWEAVTVGYIAPTHHTLYTLSKRLLKTQATVAMC